MQPSSHSNTLCCPSPVEQLDPSPVEQLESKQLAYSSALQTHTPTTAQLCYTEETLAMLIPEH
jgi:hypothetical protein